VDVFIPGCPPRPQALIHGLMVALDRMEQRLYGSETTIVKP
jgi:NADH:ubiquinone oxidoreductase subunit B-like Fe-S oxidoreductase